MYPLTMLYLRSVDISLFYYLDHVLIRAFVQEFFVQFKSKAGTLGRVHVSILYYRDFLGDITGYGTCYTKVFMFHMGRPFVRNQEV